MLNRISVHTVLKLEKEDIPLASAAIEFALLIASAALCWAAATALFALLIADWIAELALKAAETDAANALLLAIPSDINAADEIDCSTERTEATD